MKTTQSNLNTVKLGLLAISSGLSISINAAVVINEIDYDQPGSDTAEFIELYNSGIGISLDDFSITLVNGSNASSYRSIDLSGYNIAANSFFVVCGDAGLVANCNYSFTTSSGWVQNGAPDVVALYSNNILIDSFSYEGTLLPYTEGDASDLSDSNLNIASLSRILDGVDSNNNSLDFQLGCITPGTANIMGTGDCSSASISAVPVPAAAWLFGSGLIGIAGLARRS